MSHPNTRDSSTQLLRSSVRVLGQNPKLLAFTLLGFAISVLSVFFYFGLMVLPPSEQSLFSWERWAELPAVLKAARSHPVDPHQLVLYGQLCVFYVLSMVLGTFVNVAACHEIMRALAGERVSLARGLRFACTRIPSILAWSLFAAVVGMLIRLLAERLGWLGRWVLGLFGVAWSVAAVFVIPIMIRETDPNPLALMRQSAATLKKTWGEAVLGFAGIGLAGLLPVVFIMMLFPILTISVIKARDPVILGAMMGGQFLLLLGVFSLMNMANSVYRCALYVYATEGVVPAPYTPELMDAGWKIKRS